MPEQDAQQSGATAPGGRSSRGPEDPSGTGSPQVPVPPYEEYRDEPAGDSEERTHKAFDASNAPEPGEPPPISEEETSGTSSTDMEPEPALGVGKSTGRRAEDIAPDRPDADERASGRRSGETDEDSAF
jgi:hypothetical protein